jgi:hypothetical protein
MGIGEQAGPWIGTVHAVEVDQGSRGVNVSKLPFIDRPFRNAKKISQFLVGEPSLTRLEQ